MKLTNKEEDLKSDFGSHSWGIVNDLCCNEDQTKTIRTTDEAVRKYLEDRYIESPSLQGLEDMVIILIERVRELESK